MSSSETIGQLGAALAKAQALMSTVTKDGKNPHFRSSFASLAAVREACWPLSDAGLAFVQLTREHEGSISLETRLIHGESGEWIASTYPVRPVKNDPQGLGSALTYARRYSLMAILGLAPEDDDGNAASRDRERERSLHHARAQRHPKEHAAVKTEPPARTWLSDTERIVLGDRADELPVKMLVVNKSTSSDKMHRITRLPGGVGWSCTCRAGETTKRGEPSPCKHAARAELKLMAHIMGDAFGPQLGDRETGEVWTWETMPEDRLKDAVSTAKAWIEWKVSQ